MPRIFDCFTFFNENDVLAIRLEELYPVVDRFVIVQANKTFRGNPKPDYFDYERFNSYKDKIEILTYDLDDRPDIGVFYSTAWEREIAQRNSIVVALAKLGEAESDDTVIISDVDEIPRRSVVQPVLEEHRLLMDKFTYGINMLTTEGNSVVRMVPYWMLFHAGMPQDLRTGNGGKLVQDAGWEFSSLGTPEEILYKLKSFSHSEFDDGSLTPELLRERMERRQDIVGRDMYHTVVPIDDTWPEAVKNNREYWSKYEW